MRLFFFINSRNAVQAIYSGSLSNETLFMYIFLISFLLSVPRVFRAVWGLLPKVVSRNYTAGSSRCGVSPMDLRGDRVCILVDLLNRFFMYSGGLI